jgi:pyruvate oxidase
MSHSARTDAEGESAPHLEWHRALALDELPEGRVKPVTIGTTTLAMTHHDGRYGALDNRCPHQGGPLGEGTIENGWLRCPWHGWDYCPHDGRPPGGFDDAVTSYPVEVREDGVWVGLPGAAPEERTVSDVLAGTLVRWGVRWTFGMVGHSNLGMAAALMRQERAGKMGYIGIRHEGAASFACSAYGKLTGRPAACLSIAGPGATNLLTGLWDAHVDRAPAIALTGQVDTQVLGPGAFQEVDLREAFGGVAVWAQPVLGASRPAELASLAVRHALLQRGPAQLILPDEAQVLPSSEEAGSPERRLPDLAVAPPESALAAAKAQLAACRRPLIVAGHGARGAADAVRALAEDLSCPVATTFKGKGLLPDDHPLAAGVLGRSGTPVASWFMNECDLILAFGASFSNHTGITPKKPIVHVDRDPLALARFHAIEVPVQGDIAVTIAALRADLAERPEAVDLRPEVAERRALWQREKIRREAEERGQGVHSAAIFRELQQAVAEDAILCVDVGNNTYSFGRYFECRRQDVLMSGYLGSIGFALPASLGAWAATQEDGPFRGRQVVAIAGDGGLGQYLAEITTLVQHRMNVTMVIVSNGQLGKISKEQLAGGWPVWKTQLVNPDFAAYAELCGAFGRRVTEASGLGGAFRAALDHPGPALVEIVADPQLT